MAMRLLRRAPRDRKETVYRPKKGLFGAGFPAQDINLWFFRENQQLT